MIVMIQRSRVNDFDFRCHARNRIVQCRCDAALVVVVNVGLRDFTNATVIQGRLEAAVAIVTVLFIVVQLNSNLVSGWRRVDSFGLFQLKELVDEQDDE